MQQEDTLDLKVLRAALRRWAWLILASALLVGGITFVIVSRRPSTYQASSTLLVMPATDARTDAYSALVAGQQLALTYGQMLKDNTTLQAAIDRLGLNLTPEALAARMTADPVRNTQLLRLTVTAASPQEAANIANGVAEAFAARTKSLQEERVASYLMDMQKQVTDQVNLVQAAQQQVDDLTAQQITQQTEATHLQNTMTTYVSSSQNLERDRQSLQFALDQLTGAVRVVDPARPPATTEPSPYTASTLLQLDPSRITGQSTAAGAATYDQLASSYLQTFTSQPVLQKVMSQQQLTGTQEALAKMVTVGLVSGTQLVKLSVTNSNPEMATRLADAIASVSVGQIQSMLTQPVTARLAEVDQQLRQLQSATDQTRTKLEAANSQSLHLDTDLKREEQKLTEYRSEYQVLKQQYEQMRMAAAQAAGSVVISEPAAVPKNPSSKGWLNVLLATAVAVFLAVGVVFFLEYRRQTVKTTEDIDSLLGISTLGEIDLLAKDQDDVVVRSQPQASAAQSFRRLASSIRFSQVDHPIRTLLVTSATVGDGKSLVAANLAAAFAMDGLRAVAVDADMGMARLHELFHLRQIDGLSEALQAGSVNGNLQQTETRGLQVLTSGASPADSTSLVNSPYLPHLLASLSQEADIVVIDAPPILVLADATILAGQADATLLVVRADHTLATAAKQAVAILQRTNSRLMGAVLNGVARSGKQYSGYQRAKSPGASDSGSKKAAKANSWRPRWLVR